VSDTSTASHKCTSKEWYGFICVDPSPTDSKSKPTSIHKKCLKRNYVGKCKEWQHADGSNIKTDL
jgi:lipase ATG15